LGEIRLGEMGLGEMGLGEMGQNPIANGCSSTPKLGVLCSKAIMVF